MNSGSSPMCHGGAIHDYMHYEWHHTHMQSRYLLAHMLCPKTLHDDWIKLPVRRQKRSTARVAAS